MSFPNEPQNRRSQNRCFLRGFRQFSSHVTKCNACHGIYTLSPLDAALSMEYVHGWKWRFCLNVFFLTCQVRVVRFYHSCSPPPPRLAILLFLLLPLLLRQHLLHHLCLHFHAHCCLANSSPSSSPTSKLSAHCWTSTWDRRSSVSTAGPPLDLNLGPSELSEHRWTSTAR